LLHSDDELIVQSEQSLPEMRVLLDDAAATSTFQKAFPRLNLQSAKCQYLRYKPGTSCIATFVLETKTETLWAHAVAHRLDAHEKLAKALQLSSQHLERIVVPNNRPLVISLFPHDDELNSLSLLASPTEQALLLNKLAPRMKDLLPASLTTLRYKPRRRYVGRLDIEGEPQAVLKLHSLAEYRQARRAAKSLYSLAKITPATVLGHSDRHQAILLKWVQGTSLSDQLYYSAIDLTSTMLELAKLLSEVHRHPRIKLPSISTPEIISSLHDIPQGLAALSTGLAENARNSVSQAALLLSQLQRPLTSLHGDLSLDQILVGEQVSLIDFDNACLGHAEQDLGNLLAHFERSSLAGRLPPDVAERLFEILIREYLLQGGQADWSAIKLYAAISLLRMIQEPFRCRLPNWRESATEIMERAASLLEAADQPQSPTQVARQTDTKAALTDISLLVSDTSLSKAHQAINQNHVQAQLAPMLSEVLHDNSIELLALRIVRHKFGKRCLIEYTFRSRQRATPYRFLGKAHAKPKHGQNYRIQKNMWQNGFNRSATDQIQVPRPIGIVDDWQMWFQEVVAGEDGWAALLGTERSNATTQLFDTLEKLQASSVAIDRQHTITDEIQRLRQCLDKAAWQLPNLRQRISRVFGLCQELAFAIPSGKLVPTHRDFYPDQILISGREVYLLDLDLLCLSHPSLDLGNFCGHLIERAIRDAPLADPLEECRGELQSRYIREDREREWQAVEAFATLTLARHVYLSTLFPDRAAFTTAILEECERRLARQLAATTGHVPKRCSLT